MKTYWTGTSLLLTAVLVTGCGEGHAPGGSGSRRGGADYTSRLPRVEVTHPTYAREVIRKLDVSATVEALKRVDISARIPGEVRDLDDRMDLGRQVKAGEVLLRLHVPELVAEKQAKQAAYEQAVRQEKLAQAALSVARREVEETQAEEKRFTADVNFNRQRHRRIRELVAKGAQDAALEQEAFRQLESAQAGLASNRVRISKQGAKVEAALAEQELAKQRIKTAEAEVQRVSEMLDFATIRAPFDGVITRRWVDPGAVIRDPGARLLTLMQISRVRVLIDVPQRDVPNLNATEWNPDPDTKKGDPVTVRMPALPDTMAGDGIPGHITRVSGSLDPVTRTMRAEIELENPGPKHRLRPGMFGSAEVTVDRHRGTVTVPGSALVRQGEGKQELYLVTDVKGEGNDRVGTLRRVPVELGIDDGKNVEIILVQYPGEAVMRRPSVNDWIVARSTGIMRDGEVVMAVEQREGPEEQRAK